MAMGNRRGGGECKRDGSHAARSGPAPCRHTLPRCGARDIEAAEKDLENFAVHHHRLGTV